MFVRHASTTTPSSTPTSSPPPTANPSSTPPPSQTETLTWNRFLALRKTRRRVNLAASVISGLGFTAVGIPILSQQDLDAMGSQTLGLDPFIMLGLYTAAIGAVGWMVGPVVGNQVFGLWFRGLKGQIAQ
ncbi:TIM23 complex component, partial [Cryomyces antarcticus]